MKTVVITGITGTLGLALAEVYKKRGWRVIGVTRKSGFSSEFVDETRACNQESVADAEALLAEDPDVILLNAGQIETEVGPKGEPLVEQVQSINQINYNFPALVGMVAAKSNPSKRMDVVAVGSIADGSPSCFGPVYHASKAAIHYFVTGVGPILNAANANLRLRLYRPGVIFGPLSWSPTLRLNEKGYKVRAARCNKAPKPEVVATRIANWVDGDRWVGSDPEPLSFRALKAIFGLLPNGFYKMQRMAWRKVSRYGSPDGAGKESSADR